MPTRQPFLLTPPESAPRLPILTVHNARFFKSGIVVLKPDEDIGLHNTGSREEIIVVLDGQASIEIDGRLFGQISAGSMAYLPENTAHNVVNRSDRELRYMYIVSPQ